MLTNPRRQRLGWLQLSAKWSRSLGRPAPPPQRSPLLGVVSFSGGGGFSLPGNALYWNMHFFISKEHKANEPLEPGEYCCMFKVSRVIAHTFMKSTYSSIARAGGHPARLSEPSLWEVCRGVLPALHRLLAFVPNQFAVGTRLSCSNTVITVSWRHRLVCIWPVFIKALWSVWLHCPFLMWNDASAINSWHTIHEACEGTNSLQALLLPRESVRTAFSWGHSECSVVARYHSNRN